MPNHILHDGENYRCDDYQFIYKSEEAKAEASEKLLTSLGLKKPLLGERIPLSVLFHVGETGFRINPDWIILPAKKAEQYNPETFLLLSVYLESGSYMRIYHEKDGEMVVWMVYHDTAHQFVAHLEEDCSLEDLVKKEKEKKDVSL